MCFIGTVSYQRVVFGLRKTFNKSLRKGPRGFPSSLNLAIAAIAFTEELEGQFNLATDTLQLLSHLDGFASDKEFNKALLKQIKGNTK